MVNLIDWKSTRDLYIQYTYDISEKALKLLEKYGWFFDDSWFYYRPKKRPDIMKRAPIWMYPKKRVPAEAWKKYDRAQQTLSLTEPSVKPEGRIKQEVREHA